MKEVMQVVEVPPITTDRKRSWYLLVLMSLAFGMGELSHFLVGTTTRLMAQDLHYGDQSCMKGPNASARIAANVTCSSYSNATACLWEDSGCVWDYNGQGIAYQILAGPSFILVYCGLTHPLLFLGAQDRYFRVQYPVIQRAHLPDGLGAGVLAVDCTPLRFSIRRVGYTSSID